MFYRVTIVLTACVVVVASVLASVKFWVEAGLDQPLRVPEEGYVLEVKAGSSLSALSRRLAAEDILDSPYPLLIHSRLHRLDSIHAGEYLLTPGENGRQLIGKLVAGDVIRFQVTFPEGRTLRQWLEILNGHPELAGHAPLDMADLTEAFEPPVGETLEGWFFPETYTFTSRDSPRAILAQAHEKMVEVLEDEWQGRREGLPLDSAYEALILASIVEKETGLAEERPAIAGVFVRRLQQGMKLQTDPTVIYGLGERFDGDLTRTHLREENRYNTYVIARLPPTPIANPGRESIHATLHPAEGAALYFVARGDGSHYFSSTLAEHRKAVRRFQLRRSENYRSAPQ